MRKQQPFLWIDIPGYQLSAEDKDILSHPAIAGVILFTKNFESIPQLRALTQSIRAASPQLMITVDQEGGRVQRFKEGFTPLPAMSHWGRLYRESPAQTEVALQQTLTCMVSELRRVGVDATLAPVLDIDYGRSVIIGERSFGSDPNVVSLLGKMVIDQLHRLNMPVMGKHFPGHGWVVADSHETLPIDERDWDSILKQDLQPFAKLAPQLDAIMPAHVVYKQLDDLPAGFSHFWLQTVLRKQCQFDGLIVTDDLTMQGAAIYGDYITRAEMALEAGGDILIVCNSREGTVAILDNVKKKKNARFMERLARYCRWQHTSTIC